MFSISDGITAIETVTPRFLPVPYLGLLNHTHHMTVIVEHFFNDTVNVIVEDRKRIGDFYSRKILLRLNQSGLTVQFGVVRINLKVMPSSVREAILLESLPLGRILIDFNVLTTVQPIEFLKVSLGPELVKTFDCSYPATTFGRIGLISANGLHAIEVLEILKPINFTKETLLS